MQANYIGPVMVNGEMMNLFSFGDFMKDFGKGLNQVAEVGQQISGVIDQVAPVANGIW
jgi:hypothetical protein